eukprot:3848644-Rhodomonas_salina.3
MVVSCCRLSESMHTFVMLESPSSTLTKARILMGSHSLTVIRICHAICVSKVGYPTTRHIGPEAGTWELDHLIHSSPHTGVSIFVKFYSPKERQSKRLAPIWDGVIARFQSTPTVIILSLDCRGKGRIACDDHNVRNVPTIQHFRPGFSHGETYTGHVDQYHLEQWILHTVQDEVSFAALDVLAG